MKTINRKLRLLLAVCLLVAGVNAQTAADLQKVIFRPTKLAKDYTYNFNGKFEEKNIKTKDGTLLNGLLFKTESSKGLIFYLHGNAGALDSWGNVAPIYNGMHYDFFIFDYRGYGKSGGEITSEQQFYSDVQDVYNRLKAIYPEKKIIILGFSIGTGSAAMLASTNHPQKLILQAPYYSLDDLVPRWVPNVDTAQIRYKFKTYEFLPRVKCPVVIFHGNADRVIYYGSSLKLKPLLKPEDELIILKGTGHNNITGNRDYQEALKRIVE